MIFFLLRKQGLGIHAAEIQNQDLLNTGQMLLPLSHSDQRVEDKLYKQHFLEVSANSHFLSADYSETPPYIPYSEPAMILGYVRVVQLYAWHYFLHDY